MVVWFKLADHCGVQRSLHRPGARLMLIGVVCLAACCQDAISAPAVENTNNKGWIIFLSHKSGPALLYRMRRDGSGLSTVFGGPLDNGSKDQPHLVREPHWSRLSPDRKWILSYVHDYHWPQLENTLPRQFVLYLINVEEKTSRVVTGHVEEETAWHPDSKRFAYSCFGAPNSSRRTSPVYSTLCQVILSKVDGSTEQVELEKPGIWAIQDWSPDGNKLLLRYSTSATFAYGVQALIELDLEKAEAHRRRFAALPPTMTTDKDWPSSVAVERHLSVLTAGQPSRAFLAARYSPDGKSVAVVWSRHEETPGSRLDPDFLHLGILDLQTRKIRELTREAEAIHGPFCWSPDGTEIVYSKHQPNPNQKNPEDVLEIWSRNVRDGKATFVMEGWAPDWR